MPEKEIRAAAVPSRIENWSFDIYASAKFDKLTWMFVTFVLLEALDFYTDGLDSQTWMLNAAGAVATPFVARWSFYGLFMLSYHNRRLFQAISGTHRKREEIDFD